MADKIIMNLTKEDRDVISKFAKNYTRKVDIETVVNDSNDGLCQLLTNFAVEMLQMSGADVPKITKAVSA